MTDNIIKFPKKFTGKKMPVIVNVNPTSASEDLDFADNLAEGLMIGLIHNIGENGIVASELNTNAIIRGSVMYGAAT